MRHRPKPTRPYAALEVKRSASVQYIPCRAAVLRAQCSVLRPMMAVVATRNLKMRKHGVWFANGNGAGAASRSCIPAASRSALCNHRSGMLPQQDKTSHPATCAVLAGRDTAEQIRKRNRLDGRDCMLPHAQIRRIPHSVSFPASARRCHSHRPRGFPRPVAERFEKQVPGKVLPSRPVRRHLLHRQKCNGIAGYSAVRRITANRSRGAPHTQCLLDSIGPASQQEQVTTAIAVSATLLTKCKARCWRHDHKKC